MPAKYWNKTDIWYNQKTKIIELFLEDLKAQGSATFCLQSCNVSASCCAIEAVGGKFKTKSPEFSGKSFMSQADIMFSFLYSKIGRDLMPIKPKVGIVESELMDNLTFAINSLSNVKAESKYFSSKLQTVENMKSELNSGCALVLSYLTDYNSGHYITVVNWDGKHFYAYDSWPDNKHCSNRGILEKYEPSFFINRVRERFIKVI